MFPLSTGRSAVVPETTRRTSTAAPSRTAAITAEKRSKNPVSWLGTYEYTQVSEELREGVTHVGNVGAQTEELGVLLLKHVIDVIMKCYITRV